MTYKTIMKQCKEINELMKQGEEKLNIALDSMLESTLRQVSEGDEDKFQKDLKEIMSNKDKNLTPCSYLIKGSKVNFCHKAVYDKYYSCGYLINKKECNRK